MSPSQVSREASVEWNVHTNWSTQSEVSDQHLTILSSEPTDAFDDAGDGAGQQTGEESIQAIQTDRTILKIQCL